MHYQHHFIAASVFALASTTIAQLTTCDGNIAPDWEDCETMFNALQDSSTDYFPNYSPGCTGIPPARGEDPNSLRCRVQWCPDGPDVLGLGADLANAYNLIRANCAEIQGGGTAGGTSGGDGWYLRVGNNPDYEEPTLAARAEESLHRRHARDFEKRQQEGDNEYILVTKQESVEQQGIQLSGRQPAGGTYDITQTDSKSVGIESSVEVGASFFDIFSASVSIGVSQDFTTSNSIGQSIMIDCPENSYGQVFWYPLYDIYRGFYSPSQTNVDFIVPLEGAISASNYRINCVD